MHLTGSSFHSYLTWSSINTIYHNILFQKLLFCRPIRHYSEKSTLKMSPRTLRFLLCYKCHPDLLFSIMHKQLKGFLCKSLKPPQKESLPLKLFSLPLKLKLVHFTSYMKRLSGPSKLKLTKKIHLFF